MKDKFVVSCEFGTQISSMDQIFYFINCNIIIRVYLCQGLKDLWVMNSACAYIYIYVDTYGTDSSMQLVQLKWCPSETKVSAMQ